MLLSNSKFDLLNINRGIGYLAIWNYKRQYTPENNALPTSKVIHRYASVFPDFFSQTNIQHHELNDTAQRIVLLAKCTSNYLIARSSSDNIIAF